MQKIYKNIPVIPLRGLVIFPGSQLHFDVGREKSLKALQASVQGDSFVFLVAQKEFNKLDASLEDVYSVGVVSKIQHALSLPDETCRVLAKGVARARLNKPVSDEPYLEAEVSLVEDEPIKPATAAAIRRKIMKSARQFAQYGGVNSDMLLGVERIEDDGAFTDAAADFSVKETEERQEILEQLSVLERMKRVIGIIERETEYSRIDMEITEQVKKQIDSNQREYYLREKLRAVRKKLGEGEDSQADEYRERMEKKSLPPKVRAKLEQEINRMSMLPPGSHEAPGMMNYVECVLDLPWTEESGGEADIGRARAVLDEDHYGLKKVKERIVEYLAVGKLTGKINGQILCFVGPPGVGKTSICASIARALSKNFERMSLGGINDESEIRGHRRTYIGAMPGRIIAAMRRAGTVNPVILFDEIDKLSKDHRGDPAAAMLEALDSAQNFAFQDHFLELPYDLSRVMFLTTANGKETIPPPLLDRLEVIELEGYIETEKAQIARRHLIPKQIEKHGLRKSALTIPETVVYDIIRGYTSESGVRELERAIAAVCRKAACEFAGGKKSRITLTARKLESYLGRPKHINKAASGGQVGVVNGLAWTAAGGTVLQIEAQPTPGSGRLEITGKLGEVMQESVKTALTFIRANAARLNIPENFLEKYDLHVHVPDGATPKDGPSAGITIATAIASALTGIPPRPLTAMTGEITLRGRILAVGGLREKLLAAVRAGVHTVIIPEDNRADLDDVPEQIRAALNIVMLKDGWSVLEAALSQSPALNNAASEAALIPPKNTGRAVQ